MKDEQEKRAEYFVRKVCLLTCTAGNLDTARGEPATIVTLGGIRDASVNPLVLDLRDSRSLIVKMLVALAVHDDVFAQRVLDLFPADEEDNFCWPNGFGDVS